jgi:beta-carotene hydroxylase
MVGWESPLRIVVCPISILLLFSATSTSTHDVLHGSLGFSRKTTEWVLFVLGAAILESGHAYRATHLEHHRIFPAEGDLEGEAAHLSLGYALLSGPIFLIRLWGWAWRKNAGHADQRRWLALEALLLPVSAVIAMALAPVTGGPAAFVLTVFFLSWLYPTFAVWMPHRDFLDSPVISAWTVRGWLFPKLFLPLAFHLEHHLYPRIPSHNLATLSRRLEPWLKEQSVRFVHLP